jgi:Ankyrin repeats (many copies)
MSLSHLSFELLGLILANIFPSEWKHYNTGLEVLLTLRTVCRKYSKHVFSKFPLNNGTLGSFNQEILALLSKRDKVGWGSLRWAAFCGYERVIQRLLEKGADIDEKDRYGHTALSQAAVKGHEAVVKLLLEKGADVESKDGLYRQTPLLLAAERGHEAVVKLLLEKEADVESNGGAGRTRDVSGRTIGGLIGGAHNSALRGYDRLLM